MEINPMETLDQTMGDEGKPGTPAPRLNATVAITVALLATFLGICKVKDDNIVQAMQQAQANKVDQWAFYQARQLRQEVAQLAVTQLTLNRVDRPASRPAGIDRAIAEYQHIADDQAAKKQELRALAQKDQQTYDSLNYRDDQFDLADAAIAIAISLLAITALTGLPWLYAMALLPTAFGVTMGLAGLFGWPIHPDSLVGFLS